MRKEIYESIIKNSKIAYIKVKCTKNYHNKYIGIELIEQSEEFVHLYEHLNNINILDKDITELSINKRINSNFKEDEFDNFVKIIINEGHRRLQYKTKEIENTIIIDIYYLDDYAILIYTTDNKIENNQNMKVFNWTKDLNGLYIDDYEKDNNKLTNKKSIIGHKDIDLWKESEVIQFRDNESEVISERSEKTFYQILTTKSDKELYLETTIQPLIDKQNNIIGTKGSSIEIDDKLSFKKSIEQNEENFREITKYCDSVFIIEDRYRATYVSPAYRRVFEKEPDDLYEDIDNLYDFFRRVDSDNYNIDYDLNFNDINEGTAKVKLDNGKEKWIWYKFMPIINIDGQVKKRVGILTDVTDKKRVEEDKNQLKLDFFANLSHELRTPINLISSTIQLIKLNLSKESLQNSSRLYKYMDIMEMNTLRMIRLINNLLDSTRIDAEHISFSPINSDIVGFIEDICYSTAEFVKSNQMDLIFDTDSEEEIVLFDPDIIERIILNLLSNAVKFNKINGTIYVSLYTGNDKITIIVKDEGIGIPKEKINSIFNRFEQVNDKNIMEKQGSGIGLYLVKSLVKLHGGSIKVNSIVNEGSEFIISIPKKTSNNGKEIVIKNEEFIYKRATIEFSDI